MQKKGYRGGPDIHEAERQAAGLFSERFPLLDSMTIHMVYHQRGDNPILMTRTLHIYPDRDYVYFHIPCLIHDCDSGTFDLTPIVVNTVKNAEPLVEGRLNCKGGANKDLPPDHGVIQYRIEASYKTPEQLKREREAAVREEQARKEVKPPVRKQAVAKAVSTVLAKKAKQVTKKGLEPAPKATAPDKPAKKAGTRAALKPAVDASPKSKAKIPVVRKAVPKKTVTAKPAVKKAAAKSVVEKKPKKQAPKAPKQTARPKAVKKQAKKVPSPKAPVKGPVQKKTVPAKKTAKAKAAPPKAPAKKKAGGRKK